MGDTPPNRKKVMDTMAELKDEKAEAIAENKAMQQQLERIRMDEMTVRASMMTRGDMRREEENFQEQSDMQEELSHLLTKLDVKTVIETLKNIKPKQPNADALTS